MVFVLCWLRVQRVRTPRRRWFLNVGMAYVLAVIIIVALDVAWRQVREGAIDVVQWLLETFFGLAWVGSILAAVFAIPIAIAAIICWRVGPESRLKTFAVTLAVYVLAFVAEAAVLAWVPPFGEPGNALGTNVAFYIGSFAIGVVTALLIPPPGQARRELDADAGAVSPG